MLVFGKQPQWRRPRLQCQSTRQQKQRGEQKKISEPTQLERRTVKHASDFVSWCAHTRAHHTRTKYHMHRKLIGAWLRSFWMHFSKEIDPIVFGSVWAARSNCGRNDDQNVQFLFSSSFSFRHEMFVAFSFAAAFSFCIWFFACLAKISMMEIGSVFGFRGKVKHCSKNHHEFNGLHLD